MSTATSSPQSADPSMQGSNYPLEDSLINTVRSRVLAATSPFWIFLVLVLIVVIFGAKNPSDFFTWFNFKNIFIAAAPTMVMAVGMTFVIITAGIDLSCGSVLVFSGMCMAKVIGALAGVNNANAGWGYIIVGLVACLVAGILWGVLQGWLVTIAQVPPFIVTLGGFGAALGLAYVMNGGIDMTNIPTRLNNDIGIGQLGPFPWMMIIALVIALLAGLSLNFTRFGRYTFAIGSNSEGSRRSGIKVDAHLIKVYGLMGLLSGVAGFLSLAHFSSTTVASHTMDNLNVITAVILGGTSLFGGVGTMFGTVVGVLIPQTLDSGLVIAGVASFWQQVATGVILVLAVYADQLRRRKASRS